MIITVKVNQTNSLYPSVMYGVYGGQLMKTSETVEDVTRTSDERSFFLSDFSPTDPS